MDQTLYDFIKTYYGDQKAERSDVRLMNHIDEGLAILDAINASERAKEAFCIHPIVQVEDISHHSLKTYPCYPLAQEYADKANSYLCRPENDWISTTFDIDRVVGTMSGECARMLYADKIQNRKDFRMYHQATHPRSEELTQYFDLWIEYLRTYYHIMG